MEGQERTSGVRSQGRLLHEKAGAPGAKPGLRRASGA
jgi:hypothetical protein